MNGGEENIIDGARHRAPISSAPSKPLVSFQKASVAGIVTACLALYLMCFLFLSQTVEDDDVRPGVYSRWKSDQGANYAGNSTGAGAGDEAVSGDTDESVVEMRHSKSRVRLLVPRTPSGGKRQGSADKVLVCVVAKGSSTSFFQSMFKSFLGKEFTQRPCFVKGDNSTRLWIQSAINVPTCGWQDIFESVDGQVSVETLMAIQQSKSGADARTSANDEIFSFAITRDPILRFVSAYKSKIACAKLNYGTDKSSPKFIQQLMEQTNSYYGKVSLPTALPLKLPRPLSPKPCNNSEGTERCCLSFHEFVNAALLVRLLRDAVDEHNSVQKDEANRLESFQINSHYRPQSELCRYDLFTYDEVHKLEELNSESFVTLNDKIGNAVDGKNDGKRSMMRPKHVHISKGSSEEVRSEPSDAERKVAEDLLAKLRFYLDFDYSNKVLDKLYNFEDNYDTYVQGIHEVLTADRRAGIK